MAPKPRGEISKPPSFDGALCVGSTAGDWDDVELKGRARLPLRTLRAMEICTACPVSTACLQYATSSSVTGVWGGRLFHGMRYQHAGARDVISA